MTTAARSEVTVVVVPRDRFSMFPRCLDALYSHTRVPFRVFVVAAGVDEVTRAYLERQQATRDNLRVLYHPHMLLPGAARNLALRASRDRYCVLLENDAIVHDQWLPPLLECMRVEGAAAVTPLVWWYRGLHAAGCHFVERTKRGVVIFDHQIDYDDIRRKPIDYPENHCVLIDREQLPDDDLFDDVEPFDVDLGLILRKRGLTVFFEPGSEITYAAPPPLELRDLPPFKLRWDRASWKARNQQFAQKWQLTYDASAKLASYRVQQLKLGLAAWFPGETTVRMANLAFDLSNRLTSLIERAGKRNVRSADRSSPVPNGAPKLLIVDNQVADFVQYRMGLARSLRATGFDVHVAVPDEPGRDEIAREFEVHAIFLRRLSVRPVDEVRTLLSLIDLYRRLRPTVVHHLCVKPTLHGGIAARVAGVPFALSTLYGLGTIFSMRSLQARLLRVAIMQGFRSSFMHEHQRLIVQNPDDREYLVRRGIVPRNDVVVIKGSGVDVSSFVPGPEPDGPPMVLMVCRLLWEKGVGEFVAAARELRARGSQARFVLLGTADAGHPSSIPLTTLQAWHDAGDVEWLGWRSDMASILATSHVACLPSYCGEGVPRFLLEAAAAGLPLITTDAPGCREVVQHGRNGLLVPERDTPALIDAIARLLDNAELRQTMGACSRAMAVAEFAQEDVLAATLAVYRSLLGTIGANS